MDANVQNDANQTDQSESVNDLDLPRDEVMEAHVEIPEKINHEGIYAITGAQAEMYDLGNIDFIDHYFLLDLKERIAIDGTSQINQAELLSAVPAGAVMDEESVKTLEDFLLSKEKPRFTGGFPQGINKFIAVEVPAEQVAALRKAMIEVSQTRQAFDSAVKGFSIQLEGVRSKFQVPSREDPYASGDDFDEV